MRSMVEGRVRLAVFWLVSEKPGGPLHRAAGGPLAPGGEV